MVEEIKNKRKFSEEIETAIISHVIDSEYKIAKANRQNLNDDFEAYIDLLDSIRTDKDYDWMSDISIPEFASQMLTQSAIDVAQYFQTRDFVEVYLQDSGDEALAASGATKELINRTLNQRHLFLFQKFVRAKMINHINGNVYASCYWEQEVHPIITGYEPIMEERQSQDMYGNPMMEQMVVGSNPIMGERIVRDRFNFDILDPRNVFTDNKYCYSLQEKEYVAIRSEQTLSEIKADAKRMGYFNLELLEEEQGQNRQTETSEETYNKLDQFSKTSKSLDPAFDVLERHGKFWCKVTETDETGNPVKAEPGIDREGNPTDDAELLETIITHAIDGTKKVLIRFQLQPYRDADGNMYRPLIQGLCYVHPTDDRGVGDGRYCREIQRAINDSFNISNDRTMLATLPVLKVKKYSNIDNPSIRIEPGHNMEVENPEDVQELQISDNIDAALNQIAMLTGKMQQLTAIYPPTMGSLPSRSSTTATAIGEASNRSNIRTNYKSLTFENTFLTDLYWMINQMTFQFARAKTGLMLAGDKIRFFNPSLDYFYKPVSASIETEQSKENKVKQWTTILGYMVQVQHPDIVKLINDIMMKIAVYMGDEKVNFVDKLLNPDIPIQTQGQGQQPMAGAVQPMSNQNGIPQSSAEMGMRDMANA